MDAFELYFGTAGRGFVEGALVLGLFWAALGHPERIARPMEFRLSALCLGVALAATPLIRLVYFAQQPAGGNRHVGGDETKWFFYTAAGPPLLLMLAIFLGVDSVLPRRGRGEPKNPAREPAAAGE